MVVVQEPQDANALDSILDDTIQQNLSLKVLCDGEVTPPGWTSLKAVVEFVSDNDKPPPRSYAENIPVTILFTSGSTSTPKACGHSARFWSAATHARTVSCRLSKDSRVILHTPPLHILGLGDLLTTVKAGATVIMPGEKFNPTASLRAITDEGCTHVSCTSSIIDSMSRELGGQSLSTKTSSLEVINMTAGVLGTDILERAKRVTSSKRVIAFWGMTKTLFSLLWPPEEEVTSFRGVAGIGKPTPEAMIRICSPDGVSAIRRGEEGELHVGGPCRIDKYLNVAKGPDGPFYNDDHGSWMRTGDVASMDENGVVYVLGRYKDVIKRGGININPGIIESCLVTDPRVTKVGKQTLCPTCMLSS